MSVVRIDDILSVRALAALILCAICTYCSDAAAQFTNPLGSGSRAMTPEKKKTARDFYRENGPILNLQNAPRIGEVRIVGNETYSDGQVRSYITTRPDRSFDPELIQSDVRRLMSSGMFHDVRTYNQQSNRGLIVTFEVFERPTIQSVKFLGNKTIKDRVLAKECGLKVGESLNLYSIKEARRKIEQLYRTKGFPGARVEIRKGDHPQDREIVFVINEAQLQRILDTQFEGNKFVSDSRLKTKIESKRGYLWFIKGRFDHAKLEADVEKLTDYYRRFGYFRARISRELSVSPSGKWVTVTFVIDEGPRYQVRNVDFIGTTKFEHADLTDRLQLKKGDHFQRAALAKDVATIKEFYGRYGYVFSNVNAEPRFLEEPGQLDLLYNVEEGQVARVRNINVHIAGDHPHTRQSVVLTRAGIQPGDIIDSQKIRNFERRMKASQVFENNPALGIAPRVVIRPVDEPGRQ